MEAARIDGASNFQIFRTIILPLSWPGFMTAGLVIGLNVWNEFLFAVTFLLDPSLKPVATSLFEFQGRFSRDWGFDKCRFGYHGHSNHCTFLILATPFYRRSHTGGLKG
ncbi:MAG UNVERIFIED_CONTAM: ABC transporter permease subunit [Anaerolineae bacterium]|jgi:raffinose/stachyose/melibiose transport system permease protein